MYNCESYYPHNIKKVISFVLKMCMSIPYFIVTKRHEVPMRCKYTAENF